MNDPIRELWSEGYFSPGSSICRASFDTFIKANGIKSLSLIENVEDFKKHFQEDIINIFISLNKEKLFKKMETKHWELIKDDFYEELDSICLTTID